jgi:hypothetical protein
MIVALACPIAEEGAAGQEDHFANKRQRKSAGAGEQCSSAAPPSAAAGFLKVYVKREDNLYTSVSDPNAGAYRPEADGPLCYCGLLASYKQSNGYDGKKIMCVRHGNMDCNYTLFHSCFELVLFVAEGIAQKSDFCPVLCVFRWFYGCGNPRWRAKKKGSGQRGWDVSEGCDFWSQAPVPPNRHNNSSA